MRQVGDALCINPFLLYTQALGTLNGLQEKGTINNLSRPINQVTCKQIKSIRQADEVLYFYRDHTSLLCVWARRKLGKRVSWNVKNGNSCLSTLPWMEG